MVKRAQAQLAGNGRIIWIVSDVESMRSGQPFDLVASSSSLHWITPLTSVFGNIHALLAAQGHLVFSLMLDGTLGELHAARLRISPHKPAGAKLPSKEEVLEAMKSSGFELDSHECVSSRMEFASASEFLKHLHDQGLTGGKFSTGGIPLTRSEIGELVSDYDSNYKTETGGVYATYEVLYVVATKLA